MTAAIHRAHEQHRARLDALQSHLAHLSPHQVLARGYSIVRDDRGRIVRSSADIGIGMELRLQFGAGWARSRVSDKG